MARQVIIFGASAGGRRALRHLAACGTNDAIVCFADNDPRKQGTLFEGLPVIRPEDIAGHPHDIVLVASWYATEIGLQLLELGIPPGRIETLSEGLLLGDGAAATTAGCRAAELGADYTCPLPSDYIIETGNYCNLRCPVCPTGLQRRDVPRGLMSLGTYRAILEQTAGHARHHCLFNFGEPFLNRDILAMVSSATERAVRTTIHSNLCLRAFDDPECEAIVRSGLGLLHASIDGATPEIYRIYRRRGRFQLALSNLRRIRAAKDRLGSPTPELVWGFLVHRHNEHELAAARRLAAQAGVRFRAGLLDACGDERWTATLASQPWLLHPRDAPGSPDAARPRGPAPLPTLLDSITLHRALRSVCIQPFRIMVIHWNGDTLPCCAVSDPAFRLGNIHERPLTDLWNNDEVRRCREFLYNFGPAQHTHSKCERLACGLRKQVP